jgi:hypothetical protein
LPGLAIAVEDLNPTFAGQFGHNAVASELENTVAPAA